MDIAWELFGGTAPGWAPRAGDLRLRARPHDVRLPGAVPPAAPRAVSPSGAACAATSRTWRLRSAVPEYPGPLLHRISGRHRRAAGSGADGFQRLVRGLLGGRWYTFDARHNVPRIGRVLIARGRDAADVAITTTFGQTSLKSFIVTTREVEEDAFSAGEAPKMASTG